MIENICEIASCTGCFACANICKQNAIKLVPNNKGFLYPVVDLQNCVNCGLCIKTCPENRTSNGNKIQNVYAAVSKDDGVRKQSSSGGVFSALATWVLKKNGIVCGAAIRDDLTIGHIFVSDIVDLSALRGSKYVQSEIGNSYFQVKEFLEKKQLVLFSGTPCQVSGLKAFLKKDYENLITIDILCHGVPSPLVFKKFIESKSEKSSVKNVLFRYKYPGWQTYSTKICYENGTEIFDNSYVRLFLKDLCLRDSCYRCKYTTEYRMADITLGDFWAYSESAPEYIQNDDLGISLVGINTYKGQHIFKSVKRNLGTAIRTIEDAKKGNFVLYKSSEKNERCDEFWEDIAVLSWEEIIEKYNISSEPEMDYMSKEDREYYAQPYVKRHRRHIIHCMKLKILNKLKGN